jgi:Family of unknown function (DUF6152)
MFRRIVLLAVPVVLSVSPMLNRPVLAHHSTAAYQEQEVVQKGTVVEYDWGNPHVVVVWDVKDESGNTVRWTGGLASVSSLLAVHQILEMIQYQKTPMNLYVLLSRKILTFDTV